MYQLYRERPRFVFAIVFANFVLSAWAITLDPVVNNDGITYLAMAELYLQGNWEEANSYYSWPFYPLLIASVSKVFFIDVTAAAHLLNTLLATSMSLAFVAVVGELTSGNKRILLIAAIVVLFFPSIIKYRAYIVRDFGYLSCYLWSLYFLFRFCSSLNKKHFMGWLTATALSCLFRFEGIILMLVAPYFLFIFSTGEFQHRKKILATLSIGILLASITVIAWYLQDKYYPSVIEAQHAGREISNVFDLLVGNMLEQVDHGKGGVMAYLTPLFSTTGNVIYDLIRRMAVIYFFVGIVAYYYGLGLPSPLIKRIWLVYLASNLVMLIGFGLANNLTVSRYTLATGLTILLLVPSALYYCWLQIPNYSRTRKITTYMLFVLIALVSVKSLYVSNNKNHLVTAGEWMDANLPSQASLFSNDRIVVHYANQGPKSNFVDKFTNKRMAALLGSNTTSDYDFIAISVTSKNPAEDQFVADLTQRFGKPLVTVHGVKNRQVAIFTTKAQYQHLSTVN